MPAYVHVEVGGKRILSLAQIEEPPASEGKPTAREVLAAALTCEELDDPKCSSADFLGSLLWIPAKDRYIHMCLFVGSVYTLAGGSIRPIRPYREKPDQDPLTAMGVVDSNMVVEHDSCRKSFADRNAALLNLVG